MAHESRPALRPSCEPTDEFVTRSKHAVAALRKMAAELRSEAEYNAKTSRDFGRGMAWAATIVAARADDAEVGMW